MDFSFVFRIIPTLFAKLASLHKGISAKRKAAQGALIQVSARKIHDSTLVQIGANPSFQSSKIKAAYDLFVRQIVKSPALNQAHVPAWISLQSTQIYLQQIANAHIGGAPVPINSRSALIASYMEASGDNAPKAEGFIDLVSSVLVAGLMGEVKDDALSAQIQISATALHRRFDSFDQLITAQYLPEPEWSMNVAHKENEEWLKITLSNSRNARVLFRQYLSPADTNGTIPTISRSELIEGLDRLLVTSPIGGIVAVTGDEGNGKSWLVAQT